MDLTEVDGAIEASDTNLVPEILISALDGRGVDQLKSALQERVEAGKALSSDGLVTNARHLEALQRVASAIVEVKAGLQFGLSGDLLALHIREALHYIGEITGDVQVDRDVLGAIFGKFCIGK
jgi:tRNA modification GTPase